MTSIRRTTVRSPLISSPRWGKGADLDGRYRKPAFNGLLFIALAHWAIDCAVPRDLVARIAGAQQANGSWNFAGVSTGSGVDIDTSSLAVIALTRAGRPVTDPAIAKALTLLARQHRADGSWQTSVFPPAVDDPNSTSLATLAVAATGQDPNDAAWRNAAAPELTGRPYVSPGAWLRSQQQSDGHIASPGDSFAVTTFATTQAIEALTHAWFTAKPASTTFCPLPGGPRERFLRGRVPVACRSHRLARRPATRSGCTWGGSDRAGQTHRRGAFDADQRRVPARHHERPVPPSIRSGARRGRGQVLAGSTSFDHSTIDARLIARVE